jgi:hypothetical protein
MASRGYLLHAVGVHPFWPEGVPASPQFILRHGGSCWSLRIDGTLLEGGWQRLWVFRNLSPDARLAKKGEYPQLLSSGHVFE